MKLTAGRWRRFRQPGRAARTLVARLLPDEARRPSFRSLGRKRDGSAAAFNSNNRLPAAPTISRWSSPVPIGTQSSPIHDRAA